jgi:hypothetical protein
MEEEVTEGKLLGTFEKYDEFQSLQNTLLVLDLTAEPDHNANTQESGILGKLNSVVSPTVFGRRSWVFTSYFQSLMNIKSNPIFWILF